MTTPITVATLTFTPTATSMCMGYANFSPSAAGGGGQIWQLVLVTGGATSNNGNMEGIPENVVPSFSQSGPQFQGNVGSALFSVIGGVQYTLELQCVGYYGIVTSSTVSAINLAARAYDL